MVAATPPRAQKVIESYAPRSASGPRAPCPVPQAYTIDGFTARTSSMSRPSFSSISRTAYMCSGTAFSMSNSLRVTAARPM